MHQQGLACWTTSSILDSLLLYVTPFELDYSQRGDMNLPVLFIPKAWQQKK